MQPVETDSNGALSSRGSTKATGEDDTQSAYSRWLNNNLEDDPNDMWHNTRVEEEEKEENGQPRLTNKFLRELFKKEFKKYYRTPSLNEKIFLHYKGF